MSKEAQSWGEQSARFSLYAPFVAIVIGVFTLTIRDQEPGVGMAIAVLNLLLIAVGLLLGVVALCSIGKFGKKGILWRSIAGVAFNAIILMGFITTLLVARRMATANQNAVGHWQIHADRKHPDELTKLTLSTGGKFDSSTSAGDQILNSVDGSWSIERGQLITLTIKHVAIGKPSAVGQVIPLGRIKSADEKQMTLGTDAADEIYTRVP